MSVSGPPARIDEPRPGFAVRPTLRVVPAQPAPVDGFDPTGAALHPVTPSEQAFGDLVLLVALACQAPAALLAVPGADGSWQTLSHGFDSTAGLDDPVLFDLVAASRQLVEIADMTRGRPAESPLASPPHLMRWAFGVSLRDVSESVGAVLVVLDRGFRQVTGREQRSLAAAARQLVTVFALAEKEGPEKESPGKESPGKEGPEEGGPEQQASARSLGAGVGRAAAAWAGQAAGAGLIASGGGLVAIGAGAGRLGPNGHPGARAPAGLDASSRGRRDLLRSHEVAEIFKVTERTVVNWAAAGKLPSMRTVGGHLRFRQDEIQSVLDEVRSKGRRARFGRPGYALVERGRS